MSDAAPGPAATVSACRVRGGSPAQTESALCQLEGGGGGGAAAAAGILQSSSINSGRVRPGSGAPGPGRGGLLPGSSPVTGTPPCLQPPGRPHSRSADGRRATPDQIGPDELPPGAGRPETTGTVASEQRVLIVGSRFCRLKRCARRRGRLPEVCGRFQRPAAGGRGAADV